MSRDDKNIPYRDAFYLFCESPGAPREWMTKPFLSKDGKWAVATDGFSMIFTKRLELFDDIKKVDPKYDKVVSSHIKEIADPSRVIQTKEFDLELVPNLMDEIIYPQHECPECHGEGEVEWEYSGKSREYCSDFTCPVCDRDGTEGKPRKSGRQIPDPNKLFKIENVIFSDLQLRRLLTCAQLIESKVIYNAVLNPKGANIFQVKDFYILIMPMSTDRGQKTPQIKFKKLGEN